MTINNVYITSTSSISCAGLNNTELFERIYRGDSGLKEDKDFFYSDTVPVLGKIVSSQSFNENLIEQCNKILESSNLENFDDTLLIVGSSVGGMSNSEDIYFKNNSFKSINPKLHNVNAIAYFLKKHFNFYDDVSFSSACTSSANALGYAYEVLSKGIYKNALVIGADQLCKTTVGGFLSLGILSSNRCKPFSKERDGMNVSEAIACLLIETNPNDNAIKLCGVGYSSDAAHITKPHVEGTGAMQSMQGALNSANLIFSDISYINAHGTGTITNDLVEANALDNMFLNCPYVSSTKSIIGHSLGAAGAIEAVICCGVVQRQIIPKSVVMNKMDDTSINIPFENISTNIDYVMSNSFAFGGNNCSLIFGAVK